MVIAELIKDISCQLKENGRFEAELMVMKALQLNRTELVINSKLPLMPQDLKNINAMLKRRLDGEPLQYILNEAEFMSLDFSVNRGVLIPRSDTETLVELVLDKTRDKNVKIADICTGSGCIGISLAYYNKNAAVDLFDVSDVAIETAKSNVSRHNLAERVNVYKTDILKEYPTEMYDIVVSNPPYIEKAVIDTLQTEVKDYEPLLALDGGNDGLLFYRRITEIAHNFLKKDGLLAYEIGYNQAKAVNEIMAKDFYDIEIFKDLCSNDRVIVGKLK